MNPLYTPGVSGLISSFLPNSDVAKIYLMTLNDDIVDSNYRFKRSRLGKMSKYDHLSLQRVLKRRFLKKYCECGRLLLNPSEIHMVHKQWDYKCCFYHFPDEIFSNEGLMTRLINMGLDFFSTFYYRKWYYFTEDVINLIVKMDIPFDLKVEYICKVRKSTDRINGKNFKKDCRRKE